MLDAINLVTIMLWILPFIISLCMGLLILVSGIPPSAALFAWLGPVVAILFYNIYWPLFIQAPLTALAVYWGKTAISEYSTEHQADQNHITPRASSSLQFLEFVFSPGYFFYSVSILIWYLSGWFWIAISG